MFQLDMSVKTYPSALWCTMTTISSLLASSRFCSNLDQANQMVGHMLSHTRLPLLTNAASSISVDGHENSSLLRDIDLGQVAGPPLSKTIHLKSSTASTRSLEISVQTTAATPNAESQHTEETQCTVVLPVLHPFFASSTVKIGEVSGLAGERYATVTTTLTAPGPRPLTVDSLLLVYTVRFAYA